MAADISAIVREVVIAAVPIADVTTLTTVSRWIREGRLKAIAIEVGPRPIYRVRESDFRDFVRRYVRGLD